MIFLKKSRRTDLSTTDFTLSNWREINRIAVEWIENQDPENLNLGSETWYPHVPSIDVWLKVEDPEVHYVSHIIPTLDWSGGSLGVRLTFEPKSVEELYKNYKLAFEAAKSTGESRKESKLLKLWPRSMRDFLDKELHKHFEVKAYILDPSKCDEKTPQNLPENLEPVEGDPFGGLFKIDIINIFFPYLPVPVYILIYFSLDKEECTRSIGANRNLIFYEEQGDKAENAIVYNGPHYPFMYCLHYLPCFC